MPRRRAGAADREAAGAQARRGRDHPAGGHGSRSAGARGRAVPLLAGRAHRAEAAAVGSIGRVDHATVVDRRNQPARSEGPWFKSLEYAHLQDIATHHFDLLRIWFGQPTSIFARAWRTPWSDYERTCNTEAVLTFGDVHVQYLGTLASHRFAYSLWIEGEQGAIWTNRKYVLHAQARRPLVHAGAQRGGAQGRRGALPARGARPRCSTVWRRRCATARRPRRRPPTTSGRLPCWRRASSPIVIAARCGIDEIYSGAAPP